MGLGSVGVRGLADDYQCQGGKVVRDRVTQKTGHVSKESTQVKKSLWFLRKRSFVLTVFPCGFGIKRTSIPTDP